VKEVRCRKDYEWSEKEKWRENDVGKEEWLNECDGKVECGRNDEWNEKNNEKLWKCKNG
jgi:hypothetical protein